MADQTCNPEVRFLAKVDFQRLIDAILLRGYKLIGPRLDQGAIVYGDLTTVDELPRGWTDEQGPGKYRLKPADENCWFGFAVGPHSWKASLFPARAIVATAERNGTDWSFQSPAPDETKYAFLGVRACELAAIAVQDRVFLDGPYVDPIYQQRRRDALLIAVNCTQAAATCFCTSMNTGPRCRAGFDLALTEIEHGFAVESGSERGQELLEDVPTRSVEHDEFTAASAARERPVQQISKHLNTDGIRDLLLGNLEHTRWDDVAARCLSCTNCTMVCPTCFCSSVEDLTDLNADHVQRERTWDSCFNIEFSHLSGGPLRNQIRSRYRQWLTHKLASWHDQFGTSGCVGCGRCITWCPVGIDLTEEVAAIRESTNE